jgi:hypothetical protein
MAEDGKRPRRPYKAGNDDGTGGYLIGKNRPPEHGKFTAGDGRRRGRRSKGVRNFDTDLQEEASRKVAVRENGQERRHTKQRAAIIRLFDNAYSKGQNQALALLLPQLSRLGEKRSQGDGLTHSEEALIDQWIAQRAAALSLGDPPNDPAVPGQGGSEEPNASPGDGEAE